MNEKRLKNCPFCGGEAEMKEFYESCDGRGDRHAKITCCQCETIMYLTFNEFYDAEKEFGYTGGYYSQNKAFWNGMHQKLIDKWNTRKPMEKIVERLEYINKTTFELAKLNWGEYQVGVLNGVASSINKSLEIVKEEGGLND